MAAANQKSFGERVSELFHRRDAETPRKSQAAFQQRAGRRAGVWIGAVALLPCLLLAQPGTEVLRFHSAVDDSEQPYAIYTPAFEAGKLYPLIVSLHEEHSLHRLNLQQILGIAGRPGVRRPDAVIACPLARGTIGYRGIAEQDVYDMLADVERRFPIDPDRVYLTGISMGGAGALRLALTRPDIWAAVAVVSPAADPPLEGLAGNALNLPVRIDQGDQDVLAPVEVSRAWQRRLIDAGAAAEYFEYPGVRHNAWEVAYHRGGLIEWLEQYRRNRAPRRVRFATDSYRYAAAYWVRIDGLTPGTMASIDAERQSGSIAVKTVKVDGFTLTPGEARPGLSVSIDGASLRVRAGSPLSFRKTAKGWQPGLYRPAGKRAGAEGPMVEAVSGRHIYVYGTLGATAADPVADRKRRAEQAAQWADPDAPLTLKLPVKADTALTDDDLASADLVLFGTARTNAAIARLVPDAPIALNPGAADYGLLLIAPEGAGPVALISSGLPWWTGADARPGGWPFAPPPLRLLSTFGDYVLFKGSLANVVAEGRFDRDWKLPEQARERLAASGTVTLR